MKDIDTFKSYFGGRFWKKIKESVVPFNGNVKDKIKYLEDLYKELQRKSYQPSLPREYIVSDKHNLVSRIVPAFTRKDYCVYFYCLKAIDEYITDREDRITGTFGGWTLNNGLREAELEEIDSNENALLAGIFYAPDKSYNPKAWRKHWKEFQKRAYEYAMNNDYTVFIKFDIANFYDCINLNILEKNIRIVTKDKDVEDEIEILFYFLKQWNKIFEGYYTKHVGLPQDEIGDCSRILANFYLQPYDTTMFSICDKMNSKYLRYADDQIIFSPDMETAEDIIFEASKELHKIGLNINSGKVQKFDNLEEFNEYWAFDIFELLKDDDSDDRDLIKTAIEIYLSRDKTKFRHGSVLHRLLYCNLNIIDQSLRDQVMSELLADEFLSKCDFQRMKKVYEKCSDTERIIMFGKLDELCNKVRYNNFHYNLKKFYSKFRTNFNIEVIENRINEIKIV